MSPDAKALRAALPELPLPFRAAARASVLGERVRDLAFGPGLPRALAAEIDRALRALDALLDAEVEPAPRRGDTVVIQTGAGQRTARVLDAGPGWFTAEGDGDVVHPRAAAIRNFRNRPEPQPTRDQP